MTRERLTQAAKWLLLVAVTVAVTVPLAIAGVPSAALFAALVVGIVLALISLAPKRVPLPVGIAAQGVLGVYIGTMVKPEGVSALGSYWPIVVATAAGTLALSIVLGALLGMNRNVSALTGSLALTAGGATGLLAIAREIGGDDRVVAVVQYLRVALVTASMPLVVTVVYRADKSHPSQLSTQNDSAPWYLSVGMIIVLIVVGAALGRLVRIPGSGLLGPMALTVVLQLTGLSHGLTVPTLLVQVGYMVIGWQAGVAFTRDTISAVGRLLPLAICLIFVLGIGTALLGLVLSNVVGFTPLEGYLATSPGGLFAVLATAVETGSNVTFIVAAQVVRILMMLFAAPVLARAVLALTERRARRRARRIAESDREPLRIAE